MPNSLNQGLATLEFPADRARAKIASARRLESGLLIKRWSDGISEQPGYAGVSRQAGGVAR